MRKAISMFLCLCLVMSVFIPTFAGAAPQEIKLTASDITCTYEDIGITATVEGENTLNKKITIQSITTTGTADDVTDKVENKTVAAKGKFSYELKFPDGKEVGQYKMSLTVKRSDGKTFTKEVTVTVEKKKFALPTVAKTYIYNGEEQQLELDGFDEKYMAVSEEYCKATKADHYAPIIRLKDTKNTAWLVNGVETIQNQSINWEIQRKTVEKLKAVDKEYVYDETEQTFRFRDEDYQKQTDGDVIITGDKRIDAGTSTVTVSLKDPVNYAWEDDTNTPLSFTWTIKRKQVDEPQTVKTSYDYDGSPHEITFGENQINDKTMTVSGNSRTERGTQEVTVSLKDKTNYEWASGNDTDLKFILSIGEPIYAVPTIVGTYTYNTKTQHPTLTGFDNEKMTIEDNAAKKAGTYTVTVKLKDKVNARWADTNNSDDRQLTWIVQKAPVTVKAKDIYAKQGDPVPTLNADSYTIKGVITPDRLGFVPSIRYANAPDMSAAGEYDIIVSGARASTDGNYAVTYENAKLTVGKKSVNAIPRIEITFDLPIMGCKAITDSKGIANEEVGTSYAKLQIGSTIHEIGTDKDITAEVQKDGLKENQRAYALLKVTALQGQTIDKDKTTVTINATALSKEDVKALSEGKEIKYSFTTAAYRIHFSKGNGSGNMLTQYAGTNEKYVVPASSFTAPQGYEFDKWQYKGTSKTVGANERITLTDSINLVALYKEKKSFGGGGAAGGGSIGGGGGGLPTEVTPIKEKPQKPTIEVASGVTYTVSRDGTAVVFTTAEGYKITSVTVNGVDRGTIESITGLQTGDSIKVAAICAQDVKNEAKSYSLIARSKLVTTRNGKQKIKVYWYDETGKKLHLDGYEIYRSTKKFSGFKLKYTTKREKYYNTHVKAGNKYYYRMRGYISFDGKTYYTPWSKKAWRTVSK